MKTAEDFYLEEQPEVIAAEQRRMEANNHRADIEQRLNQGDLMASTHNMSSLDIVVAAAEFKALKTQLAEAKDACNAAARGVEAAEMTARRRVRASLIGEHQQLARDIVDAARTLRDALRAEREFRERLDNGRIGWGAPLQSAAVRDAVAHANPGGGACGFTVEELLTRHIDETDPAYIEV